MYSELFKICVVSIIKVCFKPPKPPPKNLTVSTSNKNNHLSFSQDHNKFLILDQPSFYSFFRFILTQYKVPFFQFWCNSMVLD